MGVLGTEEHCGIWRSMTKHGVHQRFNLGEARRWGPYMLCDIHASYPNMFLDLKLWGRCKFGTHQQGDGNEIVEHKKTDQE